MSIWNVGLISVLFIAGIISPLQAQRSKATRKLYAVDEVILNSGNRMYGIVQNRNDSDELQLVVERAWFQKHFPKNYSIHAKLEFKQAQSSFTQQLDRLKKWQLNHPNDERLLEFIDQEVERVASAQAPFRADNKQPQTSRFTLVNYSRNEIRAVNAQDPANIRVAGVAWKHKVRKVSSRTVAALQRDLKKLKIDIETETFDLSAEMFGTPNQSDKEWNARVALFEYVLFKELNFQGLGTNLIRVDKDNPAKAADLIQGMVGGAGQGHGGLGGLGGNGLGELLKELNLGEGNQPNEAKELWWTAATKIAEKENIKGLRISRVIQVLANPVSTVEDYFIAEVSPGIWRPVIQVSNGVNRNEVEQSDMDELENDPRIKQALTIAKGLGINSDNAIKTALRHGAATNLARKKSQEMFFDELDRFTERTDGPALLIRQ